MPDLLSILQRYWGYPAFRPQQQQIIEAVLGGRDTLALMPTGGGKSLCYQVPALAQEGICLVVSPLIALMKDQVESLKSRGIGALMVYAGMPRKDVLRTLENARQDYFKFLYVSPERLDTSLFKEYLPALNVNLVAVDEAHCISHWGYDFRPAYLKIAALREELPGVPFLAVTASATAAVQADICEKLQFKNPAVFRQSFERKNLSYSVFDEEVKTAKLLAVLKKVPGSAIVYCKTRKRTTEVAALLQLHGFSATFYHAGLSTEERGKRQQAWIENRTRVVVCTNAFGMGIDKPDVRLVVHADAPDCLENYYQEAGRAGRDGQRAYAVLLCNEKDRAELENLPALRYPTLAVIRTVYEALCNCLQLHLHQGQGFGYPFRFEEFVRNFKLKAQEALYALQALESDGWLLYNEKNFSPSTVCFTTTKNGLYEFYRSHPEFENLLTTLLRTYEGIFDYPVFVSEVLLAKLLYKDEATVKESLLKATAFGVLKYTPQNDAPQIFFLKNRVAAADLQINGAAYARRKEAFTARTKAMVAYSTATDCRSRRIGQYFGDAALHDCGICDVCLQKKRSALSGEEFSRLSTEVLKQLSAQPARSAELAVRFAAVRPETLWEVVRFLEAENKIAADADGRLSPTGLAAPAH